MKIGILSSFILLTSSQCIAGLNVIADLGGISTTPFFESLSFENNQQQLQSQPSQPLITLDDNYGFPVISEKIRPGKVSNRHVNFPGLQPIFIIGHDRLSLDWLDQRKNKLRQLNAIGFVTNLNNRAEFDLIQAAIPNLSLHPLSVDDIAEQLSIEGYPVLITTTTIEQ